MKKKGLFIPLILFFTSFSFLYPITKMFFLRDDFTLLYKIQNSEIFPYPYERITTFYKPIYNIFDLNVQAYFWLSLILFSISTVFVFFLLSQIAPKRVAFLSSVIYGTGLIALENMIQIVYSVAIPVMIILFTTSIILFIQYLQKRKSLYFILSLVLYVFILEFFAHRAQLIYAYFFLLDLIFFLPKEKVKSLSKRFLIFVKRQSPYLALYVLWYFFFPTTQGSKDAISYILSLIRLIFSTDVLNIFVNFTNLLIQPFSIIFNPSAFLAFQQKVFIGIAILILSLFTVIIFWKRHRPLSQIVLFSLLTLLINRLAFLLFNPEFQIEGVSRYHTLSTITFGLYIVSLLMLVLKVTKLPPFVTIGILTIYIFFSAYASYSFQNDFNKTRSIPTKNFYRQLKAYLPEIPKGSLLYFDRQTIIPYDPSEFFRVGRKPTEAAFASIYKIPIEDITFTDSFEDVQKHFERDPSFLDKIFSFYITDHGLISTTVELRSKLLEKRIETVPTSAFKQTSSQTQIANCKGKYSVGMLPFLYADSLNLPSIASLKLNLTLKVSPLDVSKINYPLYQLDNIEASSDPCSEVENLKREDSSYLKNLSNILSLLVRQKELLSNTFISSTPSLPKNQAENLIDQDTRTVFTPDISHWAKTNKAEVVIRYAQEVTVNRLVIIPANYQRLPRDFRIVKESQGERYDVAVVKNASPKEGEGYEVSFKSVTADTFRIEITGTNTGLAPQLSEVYFIEPRWSNISLKDIEILKKRLGSIIPDSISYKTLSSYFGDGFELFLHFKRDKDFDLRPENYVKFKVIPDGALHTYSITIPAGGTKLEKVKITGFRLPAQVEIIE